MGGDVFRDQLSGAVLRGSERFQVKKDEVGGICRISARYVNQSSYTLFGATVSG